MTKDAEITRRDERILALEQRQRELELRLEREEATRATVSCPFNKSGVPPAETT